MGPALSGPAFSLPTRTDTGHVLPDPAPHDVELWMNISVRVIPLCREK